MNYKTSAIIIHDPLVFCFSRRFQSAPALREKTLEICCRHRACHIRIGRTFWKLRVFPQQDLKISGKNVYIKDFKSTSWLNSTPVSYTHLDVYKRQIPYDAGSGRKSGSDRSGLWWLHTCFFIIFLQIISFKDDLNHKGAAWTNGNVFPIKHIINVNLKPVSTRTWICEDLGIRVEGHVFNFDLIISRHF